MRTRRSWLLLVGRASEQGALGLSIVLLATRLEVSEFGIATLLLVANSLAVTVAHYGVGQAALSLAPGRQLSARMLRQTRLLNGCVAGVALSMALLLEGDARWAVLSVGVIWGLAGEAFIRKAAAVRQDREFRAAFAEMAGAAGLIAIVVVTPSSGAVLGLGLALAMQHLIQVVLLSGVNKPLFGDAAGGAWPFHILVTQILGFATANVDYVLALIVLGPGPLGLYTLAFRIANIPQAQVANVAARLALVDLSRDEDGRADARFVTRLFAAGLALMLVTMAAAPLLPSLGDQWSDAVPVLVVVAVATPWRMVIGVAGSLAIASGQASRLVRWEVGRLAATALVIALGAVGGFRWFVVATSIVAAVASAALHLVASRRAGHPVPRWLVPAAIVSTMAALLGAMILPGSVSD